MRHALLKALSNTGHVIRCARDGEEAMQLLSEELFDVVITDYRMPRMGGLELTALVRELFGARIRIIGMSASDDCRAEFIDAGVDAFLEKPVDERRLAGLIENVLGVSSCRRTIAR